MTPLKRGTLIVCMLLGLAAALVAAVQRISTEGANRQVALALDLRDLQRMAALTGRPLGELLQAVKERGITHVTLTEWSLEDLLSGLPYPNPFMLPPNVREELQRKFPDSGVVADSSGATLSRLLPILRDVGLGYDLHAAKALRSQYGLEIIARPRAQFSGSPTAVTASLAAAQATGAKMVIFEGTEVLGNSGALAETAEGLADHGLAYGMIELVPQMGENALARRLKSRILRVHSISEAEMAQDMTPARAVDRFLLAVKERKVRVCYLRLFFNQGDLLESNLSYLSEVSGATRAAGYVPGEPEYFELPETGRLLRIALYLALGAVALWLLQEFFALSLSWFWGLFVILVAGVVVEGMVGASLSADLGAFLGAVVFASMGLLLLRQPEGATRHPLRRAIGAFLGISALSLGGGLVVAAMLTDPPHLMSVAQFRGVKLAQVLPLLLVGLVLVARAMPRYRETRLELGEAQAEAFSLREGLVQALGFAVRYWHAALVLLILAAVAVLLMRSGNESPLAPAGFERAFRSLLDRLLWVRPRTKEILFGHPLLLLSLILFFRGQKHGVWLGLTLGVVGQVSLLNTFCHLHTPVLVSLARAVHGLWMGLLVGLALWLVVSLFLRWRDRRLEGAEEGRPGTSGAGSAPLT